MNDKAIERRIVTGLIVSTDYIKQIRQIWDESLLESSVAKYLSNWCIEYYDQYGQAPFRDIEGIYYEKLRNGKIRKDLAEEIEEDILPDLSSDYEKSGFNTDYLVRQTKDHLRARRMEKHNSNIIGLLDKGKTDEAEKLAMSYHPVAEQRAEEIDIRNRELLKERLHQAFNTTYDPVLKYPGALGELLNPHLVRGGLIGIMSIGKSGKTFMLLDMAMRAIRQGARVAFFQGGDMTEAQQLMRIGVYLTKRHYREDSIGQMYEPVKDCIWNQIDECNKKERECDFGIFNSRKEDHSDYVNWYNKDNLVEAKKQYTDYSPCHNCEEWKHNNWGTAWLRQVNVESPLVYEEALEAYDKFLENNTGRFKLATYSNGTLSIPMIKAKLDLWEKEDDFLSDLILIDYADLLTSYNYTEFRHKQNDIWMGMRGLSQDRHALVVSPTQADSKAYSQSTIRQQNFSEDRRKFDHVTFMMGLNRDPGGVEKQIGIMRVNELVARESYFDQVRQVKVLQNLRRGRPVVSSTW